MRTASGPTERIKAKAPGFPCLAMLLRISVQTVCNDGSSDLSIAFRFPRIIGVPVKPSILSLLH